MARVTAHAFPAFLALIIRFPFAISTTTPKSHQLCSPIQPIDTGELRAAYHAPMNSTADSSPAPCPSLASAIRAHHSLCTLVRPGAFAQRKAVMHQWCEAPEAGGMTEREKQK
jgi:hypothetical protein